MDSYDEVTRYYIKVHLNELRKKYLDVKSLAPKAMQHRHGDTCGMWYLWPKW